MFKKKKMMNWQQFARNAYRRSDTYGFLSFVYAQEPDEGFIKDLSCSSLHLLLTRGGKWDKGFWTQSGQKICEDLAVEYTRLFLGPKNHIPPFESLYNYQEGEVRQIWGSATVDVKRIIEASGLSFREDYGSIPDHICIEMEFMQKLIRKEAELWEDKKYDSKLNKVIRLEKKFIDEHLILWIPDFCHKVMETARLDFYRNFAELTRDFVMTEKEEVENLLSFFKE